MASSVHHIEACRLIIRVEENLEDKKMCNVVFLEDCLPYKKKTTLQLKGEYELGFYPAINLI